MFCGYFVAGILPALYVSIAISIVSMSVPGFFEE
jgi:hypothetical protein